MGHTLRPFRLTDRVPSTTSAMGAMPSLSLADFCFACLISHKLVCSSQACLSATKDPNENYPSLVDMDGEMDAMSAKSLPVSMQQPMKKVGNALGKSITILTNNFIVPLGLY